MKRLLLIAYYFPPDGGPGSQRPAKFARYLPEFGWRPTVVTRDDAHERGRWDPPDPSMLNDVGPDVERVHIASVPRKRSRAARWLAIDRMQDWADDAAEALCARAAHGEWDAVLITMSPFSLARTALRLKRAQAAPVILDLRDPWALDAWMTFPTALHRARNLRLMRRSLHEVDGVIANTPEAAKRIASTWPSLPASKITTIPNGYDEADFAQTAPRAPRGDEVVLVHSGSLHSASLYPDVGLGERLRRTLRSHAGRIDRTGRTIKPFLDALELLGARQPALAARVRLHLVGLLDEATLKCIREHPRGGQVVVRGYLPHTEAVRALVEADALLLPLHGASDGDRSLIVPGKTYEYLAADRPILGCLPPGDARDLVARSARGRLADPIDAGSISRSLEDVIRLVDQGGAGPRSLPEWVCDLERRRLAGRLAQFLSSMPSPRRSHGGPG